MSTERTTKHNKLGGFQTSYARTYNELLRRIDDDDLRAHATIRYLCLGGRRTKGMSRSELLAVMCYPEVF